MIPWFIKVVVVRPNSEHPLVTELACPRVEQAHRTPKGQQMECFKVLVFYVLTISHLPPVLVRAKVHAALAAASANANNI